MGLISLLSSFPLPLSQSRPSSSLLGQFRLSQLASLPLIFSPFTSVIHMTSRVIIDGGLTHTPTLPAESSPSSSRAFKALGSLASPHLSGHISFPCPGESGWLGSKVTKLVHARPDPRQVSTVAFVLVLRNLGASFLSLISNGNKVPFQLGHRKSLAFRLRQLTCQLSRHLLSVRKGL